MPDVLIRDLPADLLTRVAARAKAEGRTLESELRDVIERAEAASSDRKRRLFDALDREQASVHFDPDPVELVRQGRSSRLGGQENVVSASTECIGSAAPVLAFRAKYGTFKVDRMPEDLIAEDREER